MPDIFVDGDACPVKSEVYRVASRHDLKVFVVSNAPLRVPAEGRVERVRVRADFGAADDWIAERARVDDVVVTADIPLAERCVKKGARVLSPTGQEFTEASIGEAMATRALLEHLRQMGEVSGGPPPFSPADRRRFLVRLEETIVAAKKGRRVVEG